jgi:hypothetical protein
MNSSSRNENVSSAGQRFVNACSLSCHKLLSKLSNVKSSVLSEFRQEFGPQQRVLELAVNEAEALAWETDFPLLVFPTLAQEKAEAATAWSWRQQQLLQNRPLLLQAA